MPIPISPPPEDMPQDVIDFRNRTQMPDEDVDALWESRPGFLEAKIRGARANIYGRLRKRYVTPMDPEPEIVVTWIARFVTPDAYIARGYNPQDTTMSSLLDDRALALAEVKEAADAEGGLYDLPLLDGGDASAIAKAGPLGSSDPSPYDWVDRQSEALYGR